ncbi:MAG TPA: hypothetical protein VMV06_05835 [Acidimicrobiales bacterium]|nr:hypothetical protein [Acidimicrobiales bacterium]
MPGHDRRAKEGLALAVWLTEDRRTVEVADGELIGLGFAPYLDEACTIPVVEDGRSPVLPGVFCTRVAGVPFHDDVVQSSHFSAGRRVEIRAEPANARDRHPLAVYGGGLRVGYLPAPVAGSLAPAGTRVGRGIIVMEWSSNGVRQGITVLGSMQVSLRIFPEA